MANKNINTSTTNEPEAKKARDWKAILYVIRNTITLTVLSTGFIGFIVQNSDRVVQGKLAYVLGAGIVMLLLYFGLRK